MARRKKSVDPAEAVTDYRHKNVSRLNIPPAGLAARGQIAREKKIQYAYNPHLSPALRFDATGGADRIEALIEEAGQRKLEPEELEVLKEALRNYEPWLEWAGKREQPWCVVDPVALHIHERVSTQAILRAVRREDIQRDLFADPEQEYREAVQFYRHPMDWTNRLILGDSLSVMASLARREALAGKVQMIYMDPPYGIKYASNFQPEVGRRDVKDRDQDLTREPEMVKAYRDTWTLGVHSYLSYLRDRLVLCRELLADTGSVFVQISDENLHRVRSVMDEVFGSQNFVAVIVFKKTSAKASTALDSVSDFLLWYAQSREKMKYKQLSAERSARTLSSVYNWIELDTGERRRLSNEELLDPSLEGDRFMISMLHSQSGGDASAFTFSFQDKQFQPRGFFWKTTKQGLKRLAQADRLLCVGNTLMYKRTTEDHPVVNITASWEDTVQSTFAIPKVYTVQTANKVIERCLLMTTDPGDLVLDPTCVRKGTRILTPLNPPVNGGTFPCPVNGGTFPCPVNGGTFPGGETAPGRAVFLNRGIPSNGASSFNGITSPSSALENTRQGVPSPLTGRDRVGLIPVEALHPGHFVLGHDNKPHQVLRVIRKPYQGTMIGIQHNGSMQTLWVTADHRILCQKRTRSYGAERTWRHVPKEYFERARTLRQEMTPAERRLWSALRGKQLGVKFRKQHPIGPYIVDFYSWEAGLVIEVDGESHFTPEAQEYDSERAAYLNSLGLTVLRFTNPEVNHHTEGVLESIAGALQWIEPSEDHYQQWRRADSLQPEDMVYFGPEQRLVEITHLLYEETNEEVYDIEVEGAHSFLTEVCAVHNCGSGTTAYVAEQWGRRWITADVSRVAVAITRQRLLTAKFDYYALRPTSAEDVQRNPDGPWLTDPEGRIQGTCTFDCKTVPHITLKSIAQNQALDPIFEKWAPILAEEPEETGQEPSARRKRSKKRVVYGANKTLFPGLFQNEQGKLCTIRIDSKQLEKVESEDPSATKDQAARELREIVNTVGKPGKRGQDVHCVVSVAMLTEGWDANNVTHILGVRAFGSQLLCEQVVGRGLRRMNYTPDPETELLPEEYVDVYGIPFSVIPYKGKPSRGAKPDRPVNHVHALPERAAFEIKFPNVEGYVYALRKPAIKADVEHMERLVIEPEETPTATFLRMIPDHMEGGAYGGGLGNFVEHNRQAYYAQHHLQGIEFEIARQVTGILVGEGPQAPVGGGARLRGLARHQLFPQVLRIVHRLVSTRVDFRGVHPCELGLEKYVHRVRERLLDAIQPDEEQGEAPLFPVLNRYKPIGTTTDVNFTTQRNIHSTQRSHVNAVVLDSAWEQTAAFYLEQQIAHVPCYVRNDGAFLLIPYQHEGVPHHYEPDYLVRLANGRMLILETKGRETDQDRAKHQAARQWISAVNNWGRLGQWEFLVCRDPHVLPKHIADLCSG